MTGRCPDSVWTSGQTNKARDGLLPVTASISYWNKELPYAPPGLRYGCPSMEADLLIVSWNNSEDIYYTLMIYVVKKFPCWYATLMVLPPLKSQVRFPTGSM